MGSNLFESVIVSEFQAREAYSSIDVTKAKYSISRLSKVEKENVIVRISSSNFSACEKRYQHGDENEACTPKSLLQSAPNMRNFRVSTDNSESSSSW
jgi:hypothetical protein